jgi:hypothetical protein
MGRLPGDNDNAAKTKETLEKINKLELERIQIELIFFTRVFQNPRMIIIVIIRKNISTIKS